MEFALPRPYNPYKKRNILIAISIISLGALSAGAILVSQVLPKREQVSPEDSSAAEGDPRAYCDVTAPEGTEICVSKYKQDQCKSCNPPAEPLDCLRASHCFYLDCPGEETTCTYSASAECGGIQIDAKGVDDCVSVLTDEECDLCEGANLVGTLGCTSLTMLPSDPNPGDNVAFTCIGSVPDLTNRIVFKVINPGGSAQEFVCPGPQCNNTNFEKLPGGGAKVTATLNYPNPIENGTYKACSKVCAAVGCDSTGCHPSNCTEFDERCNQDLYTKLKHF